MRPGSWAVFEPIFQPRPLQWVLGAWLLLLLLCWPRERRAWWVFGAAAVVRLLTWSPRNHMHGDKIWSLLNGTVGLQSTNLQYGEAWPSLAMMAGWLSGWHMDTVHGLAAVLSAVTPVWLYVAVHRATGDARAALGAGLLLAVLPLPVVMAPTETPMVLVGLLQVMAVAGALGEHRRDAWLAALSVGLLAHCRPEQVAIAGMLWLLLLWQRRWWPAVAAAGLFVWRGAEFVELQRRYGDIPGGSKTELLGQFFSDLSLHVGPGARWGFTDPTLLPVGVLLLALIGAAGPWKQRAGWALPLLAVAGGAIYWTQNLRPDQVRFHLPGQAWWAALGAVGFARLYSVDRRLGAVAVLLAALSFNTALTPRNPAWPWTVEYDFLRAQARLVPEGATVRYARGFDQLPHFHQWAGRHLSGDWMPIELVDGTPEPDAWVALLLVPTGTPDPDLSGRPLAAEVRFDAVWDNMAYRPTNDGPTRIAIYGPVEGAARGGGE